MDVLGQAIRIAAPGGSQRLEVHVVALATDDPQGACMLLPQNIDQAELMQAVEVELVPIVIAVQEPDTAPRHRLLEPGLGQKSVVLDRQFVDFRIARSVQVQATRTEYAVSAAVVRTEYAQPHKPSPSLGAQQPARNISGKPRQPTSDPVPRHEK